MYNYEELQKANSSIKTTPIKGKDYAEVNQRIMAFRSLCPHGAIVTEMLSNENGVCVFRATVYDEDKQIIGTGTAYEKESSSYINETSYIENCETSAVGRALGMCGFGIDVSIASAEELKNALLNQNEKKSNVKEADTDRTDNIPFVCSECNSQVTKQVKDYSVKKFGKCLCMTCQRKAKQ